jgi:hypothetical protein
MDTDLAGLSLFESDDIHNFSPCLGVLESKARGYIGFKTQQPEGIPGFRKKQAPWVKISPQTAAQH